MCLECDGYSFEQVMQVIDLDIRTYGWHHVLVEDAKPWSYTVGLRESFGHPELAVVDLELSAQVALVRWACESIEDSGSIDEFERSALGVEIVTVHDAHLRSGEWFGTWHAFYDEEPPPGSFLQVLPPPGWECEHHRGRSRRLDLPGAPPGGNRAQRRAHSSGPRWQ
jgi:Domain of unknown function (DUF4262)